MKRMINLLRVVAVAAVALTSCQNNFEEVTNEVVKGNVVVNFVAQSTRTSVDTTGDAPIFSWSENETFAVLEQTDALAEATNVTYENVDGKASIKAELTANPGKGAYEYVVVYPQAGFVAAESLDKATLALPAEQIMAEESYDPTADLMVSMPVQTTAQPTEAQYVRFARVASVAKMTVNNLNLGADEQVERVEFTANGKSLAGTINVDLTNPETLAVNQGVSTVSVATTSADKVYFTLLPTTLEAGDSYSVAVVTNKKVYIKQGTIPEGKSLAFEAGMVSRFSVNMADVEGTDKWTLVRDASTLKQGDVVTIVAKNYNYVIGKPSSSVYPLASQTEVIKAGNYLYHKPADDSADHMMQTYTLMQRDANRNAFDFYNGVDFKDDESVGFAWATGSNYTPKLQAFCDKNTLFDVSIADGVATITASEISGSYKYWRYYHANYATSRKFDLTNSAVTNDNNKILLYRLEGAVGEIPVVAAVVTVPDSDEVVTIAEEGAAEATAINDVVFNYVGPWAISVSDNAEWLNVAYDAEKNCLTYTADANTGAKRETTVTITATLEGQESLTWSFNLVQKGAPTEISIADFATKGKDVDTVYKLTGIITEIPSSTSGKWKLADENGNTAQVQYLKTESGENVKGNVDVKEGDVISLTTVVAGSTTGLGGSSTYPSVYKGYYRLNATADSALVGYEGGDVTISVATEGNLLPADGVIKGAMAEAYDFVTLNYTENAATATATFAQNSGSSRNVEFSFTYGLAAASVSVGQMNHPSVKVGWFLVTSLSELAVGDKVIIAGKSPDGTADYAISSKSSTSTYRPAIAITLLGNSISSVEGVQQYTLEKGHTDCPNTWAFKGDSDSKYLYYSSGLKVTSTLNANGSWAIAIAEDGKATLTSQTTNSKNTMMLNYTTSNQTFSMYEPTQADKGAIYLYKEYK